MPDDLFEKSFAQQVHTVKAALEKDLTDFAEHCGMEVNTSPFTDQKLERFYGDFGDGWWLTRTGEEVAANYMNHSWKSWLPLHRTR